ncbi:hypothetical protein Zm00014a_039356 [Zea mays]|jgi:hypothetical protein|uniref:Uncharacterized protein n=1 Tax=Zea mays TaxID=4577 RepID=A0A3L6ECP9_MAIZE|nr:hypothetical protein Zm00014a_039356 [Zea mays]
MGSAKKVEVAETTARVVDDRSTVDQAVAYVLMAAALAVTYLVH